MIGSSEREEKENNHTKHIQYFLFYTRTTNTHETWHSKVSEKEEGEKKKERARGKHNFSFSRTVSFFNTCLNRLAIRLWNCVQWEAMYTIGADCCLLLGWVRAGVELTLLGMLQQRPRWRSVVLFAIHIFNTDWKYLTSDRVWLQLQRASPRTLLHPLRLRRRLNCH